jgi:hypothetical protein
MVVVERLDPKTLVWAREQELISNSTCHREGREARRGDPAGLLRHPAKPGCLAMTDFEMSSK